jgi:septal ring factor EnvC (AmiA/AmiB activator)
MSKPNKPITLVPKKNPAIIVNIVPKFGIKLVPRSATSANPNKKVDDEQGQIISKQQKEITRIQKITSSQEQVIAEQRKLIEDLEKEKSQMSKTTHSLIRKNSILKNMSTEFSDINADLLEENKILRTAFGIREGQVIKLIKEKEDPSLSPQIAAKSTTRMENSEHQESH